MNLRHILVAASAAALLASTSYGAMAGSWSSSKSGTVAVAHADKWSGSTTFMITGGTASAGGSQAASSYSSSGFTLAAQEKSESWFGSSSSSIAIAAGSSSGCASVGNNSPC